MELTNNTNYSVQRPDGTTHPPDLPPHAYIRMVSRGA